MKRRILSLTLAMTALLAGAQNDSLSLENRNHNMQEVIVRTDLATTTVEKSTFLPTKKQKNAATDATNLLQHMMIPQLRINPNTQTVSKITGEEVTIFIDFVEASTTMITMRRSGTYTTAASQ